MKRADRTKSASHNLTRPARRTPELEMFLKCPPSKQTLTSGTCLDRTRNIR